MASKQTEALNALYRGWAAALQANPEMPLDEMRLMLEQWGNITGEPRGVDYIETSAGEVSALWAAPKSCAEDRVLLCAHGGGYVAASMYTHRKTYGHVAKAIGCRALSSITGVRRRMSILARSTTWRRATNGCSIRASGRAMSR